MFVIDKHAVENEHPADARWWVGGDTYVSVTDATEALGKKHSGRKSSQCESVDGTIESKVPSPRANPCDS